MSRTLCCVVLVACTVPKLQDTETLAEAPAAQAPTVSDKVPPIATTQSPAPSGSTGASGDAAKSAAVLVGPESIDFGYRVNGGASFTNIAFTLENTGDLATPALSPTISGDDAGLFAIQNAPLVIAGHSQATITVATTLTPSGKQRLIHASLTVGALQIPIYAAIGDPALPQSLNFQTSRWASGVITPLPNAPHPSHDDPNYPASAFVYFGLPAGFRSSAHTVDVMFALHGFGGDVTSTLDYKHYREQAYYSNRNAILIVPEGLYKVEEDDYGALRTQDGIKKLVDEVMILLFREGKLTHPTLGKVTVTGHSGAYFSMADMLGKSGVPGGLAGVTLLDAFYGLKAPYEAWARTHTGKFITSYSTTKPTSFSKAMLSDLKTSGDPTTELSGKPNEAALIAGENTFHALQTGHSEVVYDYYSLAEYWRYSLLEAKAAPQPILRQVKLAQGTLSVTVFAEPSLRPYVLTVEASADGVSFIPVAAAAGTNQLTSTINVAFAQDSAWIRVVREEAELGTSDPSDTYFVRSTNNANSVLVVDAFDRMIDGKFNESFHDFAARIGSSVGTSLNVVSCANEAVERGECALVGHTAVIWMAGLAGDDNHPINRIEAPLLTAYVASGGRLLVTGAEIGWALTGTYEKSWGPSFLSSTLHLLYDPNTDDDGGSLIAYGAGPLASLGKIDFGTSGSYSVVTPDIFWPAAGADVLLRYGSAAANAKPAATRSGKVVSVGFPIETVPAAQRASLLAALLSAI